MSRLRQLCRAAGVVLGVVVVSSSTALAEAETPESTQIDELAATVTSSDVTVSGQATFVDVPVEVGDDPAGDSFFSSLSGDPVPAGDDLTTATIARADAFVDTLTFTVDVANQPPVLSGVPELLAYRWPFSVETAEDSAVYEMVALRSGQWANPGSIDPHFMLFTCPDGPVSTCEQQAVLDGRIADGVVEWTVPATQVGVEPGSVISPSGSGIEVVASVSGAAWGVHTFDQANTPTDYTVPAPTVRLGIGPAETPPEDIDLTGAGALEPDGSFTGTLPLPDTSGDYIVVAQACYGPDSCGVATTEITVS